MQKALPLWIASAAGSLIVVEYFLKIQWLSNISKEIQSWTVLISAFLLGVGMVNLFIVNIRGIQNKKTDVLDALVLMGGMVAMFTVTLFQKQPAFLSLPMTGSSMRSMLRWAPRCSPCSCTPWHPQRSAR